MGWSELLIYTLFAAFGYALARVVDQLRQWRRERTVPAPEAAPQASGPPMSATMRHRELERQVVYGRFRKSVNDAVNAAVNEGHGSYGLLYQIRDDYGALLRLAPTPVSQAADSMIRCVTLLLNLGASDQRHAMYTRALRQFDEACSAGQGATPAAGIRRQEFPVLAEDTVEATGLDVSRPGAAPPTIHAPT